ncbi:hypothetical protein F5887DRAFT_306747 [Amanita rubescens]|nr:hypothetical protein F5887DRAFT_306747 [Amanita rubescens]
MIPPLPTMRALRLLGFVAVAGLAVAQSTTSNEAHCIQGQFSWMFNSLNQDPCTVGQNLGEVCNIAYQIPPLGSDLYSYLGPSPAAANECRCSSVLYSLLSACAVCQNGQTILWDQYDQNCSAVYVGVFLPQIPARTAVPHWAYMNVTAYDEFNLTYAQQLIGPESTTIPQPTAIPSTPSTTTTTSSSHKPSIIGPIVGSVIGSVVALALLSLAIILLLRRRHFASIESVATTLGDRWSLPEGKAAAKGHLLHPVPVPLPEHLPLLYDPSDPRTFPPTPSPSWPDFASIRSESVRPTTAGSTLASGPPGNYTGAPEPV